MKNSNEGKIMQGNHPDEVKLIAYIDAPKSDEVKGVRHHLITCASCRSTVARMQSMVAALKEVTVSEKHASEANHPDEQAIADYIDGRIDSARKGQVKAHIDSCAFCTKATLHYAVQSVEMRREMQSQEAPPPLNPLPQGEGKRSPSILQRILSWRMPVWVGVPATAFAAAIIVFILLNQGQKEIDLQPQTARQEKTKVILAYQEKPQVIIYAKKKAVPGIGFFGDARKETRPFAGLTIERQSATMYKIIWKPIDGADSYDLRIFTPGERGERSLVGAAKGVQDNNIVMDLSALDPGGRYTWELDGYLKDGKLFMTSGVFVVAVNFY